MSKIVSFFNNPKLVALTVAIAMLGLIMSLKRAI